jgi:hypothetical protein
LLALITYKCANAQIDAELGTLYGKHLLDDGVFLRAELAIEVSVEVNGKIIVEGYAGLIWPVLDFE